MLRTAWLAGVCCLAMATTAQAMWVSVDGFLITDNGPQDMDLTLGQIQFDSLPGPFGFLTLSGFDAKGRVDITGVAGALAGQLNTGQSLVLTSFVADMPAAATPGVFKIVFEHNFGPAIAGGGTAADIVVAFANDGTGSLPYATGGGAIPLLAGEDLIVAWQGYVDNVPIPNPTIPLPPLLNLPGLNTPYTTHGHATTSPLFGGLIFTPVLRGELDFFLGGSRNQFVLLTSAEVGLEDLGDPPSVPGAPLLALAAALSGTAIAALRRRRTAHAG